MFSDFNQGDHVYMHTVSIENGEPLTEIEPPNTDDAPLEIHYVDHELLTCFGHRTPSEGLAFIVGKFAGGWAYSTAEIPKDTGLLLLADYARKVVPFADDAKKLTPVLEGQREGALAFQVMSESNPKGFITIQKRLLETHLSEACNTA